MPRKNDGCVTIRMPVEMLEALAERAARDERTVAAILRLLAKQYLEAPSPTR